MLDLSWPSWKQREALRFYMEVYREVPRLKALERIEFPDTTTFPYHYLHMSTVVNEFDMVAYTETWAKGEMDRQTRLKFGRYLKRYYGHCLQDHEISAAVAELRAVLGLEEEKEEVTKLKFATGVKTVNRIFETRMCAKGSGGDQVSCMYGKWDGNRNRPYHVYVGSPDVAVAYMQRGGEILARSVVSTKDKKWVRVYAVDGDYDLCCKFEQLIRKEGYDGPEALVGNRLTKVTSDYGGEVYLPYIDPNGMDVDDEGEYWRIVRDGEYTCDRTDGTAARRGPRCEYCDRLEDYCECIYCDCCERRYVDGCDECRMCELCGRCITHDNCTCERCSECNNIVPGYRTRYYVDDRCTCDRCGECGRLEDDCECEVEEEQEPEVPTSEEERVNAEN